MNREPKYEVEKGTKRAYVYRQPVGYAIFGWIGDRINVGWYAPTLAQAKKLADAIVN